VDASTEPMIANAPQYLFAPADKPSLPLHEAPLVEATDDSVQGYGCLIDHPDDIDIEIVRWPATGWRKVDEDSGDEAGWVEGIFHGEWQGDVLYGHNEAVSGHYVLGWSTTDPQLASTTQQTVPRDQVLLWHTITPMAPSCFSHRIAALLSCLSLYPAMIWRWNR